MIYRYIENTVKIWAEFPLIFRPKELKGENYNLWTSYEVELK